LSKKIWAYHQSHEKVNEFFHVAVKFWLIERRLFYDQNCATKVGEKTRQLLAQKRLSLTHILQNEKRAKALSK
jgi:hypothetical protein